MFLKKTKKRVKALEEKIYGYEYKYRDGRVKGIVNHIKELQEENRKLKGIVAEVVDYIYSEEK